MEDITQAAAPCRIFTTDGRCFVVNDVNAWTGQDTGVFASGCWADDGTETDVLLAYDFIRYMEFDFAGLRAWQAEQLAPEYDAEVTPISTIEQAA